MTALTRVQTAARIATLRDVLDLLWDVNHATGGEPFLTIGRAKTELYQLEADLRAMDGGIPPESFAGRVNAHILAVREVAAR